MTSRKSKEDIHLIQLALHRSNFFTCLDEEQVANFVDCAELKVFEPGEVVISLGFTGGEGGVDERTVDLIRHPTLRRRSNESLEVYAVRKGRAQVFLPGSIYPTYTIGPGEMFGEGAVVFDRARSASVVATHGHDKKEPTMMLGSWFDKQNPNENDDDNRLECWTVSHEKLQSLVLRSKNMLSIFKKYASLEEEGEPYMTMDDFVSSVADKMHSQTSQKRQIRLANTFQILRGTSSSNGGKISFADYCVYHLLMSRPDPEVDIAFLLMDRHKRGYIDLDDLKHYFKSHVGGAMGGTAFNARNDFMKRHFGVNGKTVYTYSNFSQFFQELQLEMGRQAFLGAIKQSSTAADPNALPPAVFVDILKTACGWRLPQGVSDRLDSIYTGDPFEAAEKTALMAMKAEQLKGSESSEAAAHAAASILASVKQRQGDFGTRKFNFTDFVAFQGVLSQLSGICNLIYEACRVKSGPVSPDDLKVANRVTGIGGRLSRHQVDIIFQLFDSDKDGFVSFEDAVGVVGLQFVERLEAIPGREGKLTFAPPPDFSDKFSRCNGDIVESVQEDTGPKGVTDILVEAIEKFALGSVAGGIGAFTVYPIDLVKTRMQNQRIGKDGKMMYRNSLDCFRQLLAKEGMIGLYRGLLPQLVGVAPEKAIKLTVNDLLRGAFTVTDEKTQRKTIHFPLEVLSGASAGGCQVLVTNPLEIVKIRLQVQGETAQLLAAAGESVPPRQGALSIVKDLGLSGLYKGAGACLLRDIPFSAIYFPAYAAFKEMLQKRREKDSISKGAVAADLLIAGAAAGVPAAFLTTPADVIKTRLQVVTREGEMAYTGINDCAAKIYKHEGISAFFKGSGMRVFRSSPQFGVTLLAYEMLAQLLPSGSHSNPSPPTNAPVNPQDFRSSFGVHQAGLYNKIKDVEKLSENLMGLEIFGGSNSSNKKDK